MKRIFVSPITGEVTEIEIKGEAVLTSPIEKCKKFETAELKPKITKAKTSKRFSFIWNLFEGKNKF